MRRFNRIDRVSEMIRREISMIIDRELDRSGDIMISVSDVEVSRDLRHAKVYVMVYADEESTLKTVDELNDESKYIRKLLAERIQLKYLPSLTFFYDSSTVDGMKMDRLLDKIQEHN
jgi:ribosome-binding factor A